MPSTDNERAAIPLYKDDIQTAREKGELDIARLSNQTNVACAKDIDNSIAANHNNNILDTDKIVDELVGKYSAERIAHVLAARITNASWDGRYSRKARAWAEQEMSGISGDVKERSKNYPVTAHPVLVNAVAERFMAFQREREKEQSAILGEALPEQAGAAIAYPSAKERLQELTDMLEAGIRDIFASDKYREMLAVMSKFHDYSVNNTMLIAMQKPDATLVAGFNQWKKDFGRSVKKGEKGIKILAPSAYKSKKEEIKRDPDTDLPILDENGKPVKEEVEEMRMAFRSVTVFDVSQTDGKPLPEITVNELTGDIKDFDKLMGVLRDISPVPISFAPIDSEAKGFYDPNTKSITVKEGMSDVQTVKTAIHEITHAKLHDYDAVKARGDKPKDLNTKEVEAESVAFAVCQHFGIDTSDYSFGYVASWSKAKDTPELKASLETIHDTAAEMIKVISEKYLGIEKDKALEQDSNYIGNLKYSEIPDKQYQRLPTETALDVAAKLDDMGISYSGRISGDNTTLTYGKGDADAFKAVVEEVKAARQADRQSSIIGNTPFKDIPDKRYLKLKNDVADKAAEQLYAEDIPFSGKVIGGYTTITVNRDDELRVSAIAKGIIPQNRSDIIGNVKYGDIKDKVFYKLEPETAAKVAAKLDEMGISYSGKIADDKTTITVDKADTKAYNAAVKDVIAAERKAPERSDVIGNTPYRLIAEKSYRKVSIEDMQAVSDILNSLGVKFSGQIKDKSVTFTVSKADVPKIDEAINKVNGISEIASPEEKPPSRADKGQIIGNTDFKSIPLKTYTTILTAELPDVTIRLEAAGIKFSGRIDGDKTKLTTSKTDAKKLTAILDEINGISKIKETAAEKTPAKKSAIIGNTDYKSIPDKEITRVPTADVDEITKRLDAAGIKYSGVRGRDKSAITVTKSDVPKLREIVNEVGTSLADSLKPIEYQPAEKPKSTVRTSEIIGNTPYKKISEKVYQKLPTEYALKMAKELDKKGVNFSGRITGDNTVLTIEKADLSLFEDTLHDLANRGWRESVPEQKPEWKMYVIPDLYTWANHRMGKPMTPIEYFDTFAEAKQRFDELRGEAYNSEPVTNEITGRPPARLTLGIESDVHKAACDILHVCGGENVLLEDFARMPEVRSHQEAVDLVAQTAKEIGFDTVSHYEKLPDGSYPKEPEMIPFEKWDNPYFKVEREKPAEKSEHTPIYTHSLEYARSHNEMPALTRSMQANRMCAFEINHNADIYAVSGKLDQLAEKLVEKYGFERSMYVLAHNIQHDKHNYHLHDKAARDLAEKYDVFGDPNAHLTIMTDVTPNSTDVLLMKLEKLQLEMTAPTAENQHTEEKAHEKQEYTGKMPDETVTIEDMNAFGYAYEGMLPLSAEKALEMYDKDLAPVFLLYPDGTEGQALDRSEIEEHAGMFGVETAEWEKIIAYQDRLEKLAVSEPSREAMLLNDNKCMVGIYQLKETPDNYGIAFAPMKELSQQGLTPDRDNYTLVYTFEVKPEKLENMPGFLDDVYGKFNYDRPEDFAGHSLSVSDVVVVNNHGEKTAHFVDSWSFEQLREFGQVKENPLRAVEDTIEQNDNSFDGIINNMPTADEIQKRAESGERISILEFAEAIQREQTQKQAQKPEKKPEKLTEKKSILGFLRQAKAAPKDPAKKEPTKSMTKGTVR